MRAMDDAESPAIPSARSRGRTLLLGLVVVLGAVAGAGAAAWFGTRPAQSGPPRWEVAQPWSGAAPVAAEWPRPAHPGEEAVVEVGEDGPRLLVRTHGRLGAETLAGDLRRARLVAGHPLALRRVAAREAWARRAPTGPALPLSDAARALTLVHARATVARALIDAVPPHRGPLRAGVATPVEFDALLLAEGESDRLALEGSPDALRTSFEGTATAEVAWLEALAHALPGGNAATMTALWRLHALQRVATLDAVAVALESRLPAWERTQAGLAVREACLAIEPGVPDPERARPAVLPPADALVARPVLPTWVALLAIGAGVGLLLALPLGLVLARPRRVRQGRAARAKLPPVVGPAESEARLATAASTWLHVVTGPDSERVARALVRIAARLERDGTRVLIVDGGRRLRLHERFAAEGRWGLVECLAGGMPLLGAVQSAGAAGRFLLARGRTSREERWTLLGRLLEEARPHFGHVLLALDVASTHHVGDALAGRPLEGWWADLGPRLPRAAVAFSERLAIALSPMDLWPEAEALPAPSPAPLAVVEPESEPVAVEELAPVPEPAVLDCDLQVRERLRFLIWMRSVQAESRREVRAPVLTP